MATEWSKLTELTRDKEFMIESVRLSDSGITIHGDFELPPLARLCVEDQVFVAAFVRCHGSLKEMESLFGISYPTVKSRLNRIADKLDFAQIKPFEEESEIIASLEKGEITVKEAVHKLRKSS
jgi:hypothetical protein